MLSFSRCRSTKKKKTIQIIRRYELYKSSVGGTCVAYSRLWWIRNRKKRTKRNQKKNIHHAYDHDHQKNVKNIRDEKKKSAQKAHNFFFILLWTIYFFCIPFKKKKKRCSFLFKRVTSVMLLFRMVIFRFPIDSLRERNKIDYTRILELKNHTHRK